MTPRRPENLPTYEEMIAEAREAISQEGDLSPQQWVRIREGIEVRRSPWAGYGMVASLVGAAVLTVLWVSQPVEAPESSAAGAPVADLPTLAPKVGHVAVSPGAEAHGEPEPAGHHPGERLAATERSSTLESPAGHRLRLAPGSEARLEAWDKAETVVALRTGSVRSRVRPLLDGERYVVRTVDVEVSVVGTDFVVSRLDGGGTAVQVLEGVVTVKAPGQEPQHLVAGDQRTWGVDSPRPRIRRRQPADPVAPELDEPTQLPHVIEIEVPPQSAPVPESMK